MAATNTATEVFVEGVTKKTDNLVMVTLGKATKPVLWGDVETQVVNAGGDMPFGAFRTLNEMGYIRRADPERRTLELTEKGRAAYDKWAKAKA